MATSGGSDGGGGGVSRWMEGRMMAYGLEEEGRGVGQRLTGPMRSKPRRLRITPYARLSTHETEARSYAGGRQRRDAHMLSGRWREEDRVGDSLAGSIRDRMRRIANWLLPRNWFSPAKREGEVEGRREDEERMTDGEGEGASEGEIMKDGMKEEQEEMMKKEKESKEEQAQIILSRLAHDRHAEMRRATYADLCRFFRGKGENRLSREEYVQLVAIFKSQTSTRTSSQAAIPFVARSRRIFEGKRGPTTVERETIPAERVSTETTLTATRPREITPTETMPTEIIPTETIPIGTTKTLPHAMIDEEPFVEMHKSQINPLIPLEIYETDQMPQTPQGQPLKFPQKPPKRARVFSAHFSEEEEQAAFPRDGFTSMALSPSITTVTSPSSLINALSAKRAIHIRRTREMIAETIKHDQVVQQSDEKVQEVPRQQQEQQEQAQPPPNAEIKPTLSPSTTKTEEEPRITFKFDFGTPLSTMGEGTDKQSKPLFNFSLSERKDDLGMAREQKPKPLFDFVEKKNDTSSGVTLQSLAEESDLKTSTIKTDSKPTFAFNFGGIPTTDMLNPPKAPEKDINADEGAEEKPTLSSIPPPPPIFTTTLPTFSFGAVTMEKGMPTEAKVEAKPFFSFDALKKPPTTTIATATNTQQMEEEIESSSKRPSIDPLSLPSKTINQPAQATVNNTPTFSFGAPSGLSLGLDGGASKSFNPMPATLASFGLFQSQAAPPVTSPTSTSFNFTPPTTTTVLPSQPFTFGAPVTFDFGKAADSTTANVPFTFGATVPAPSTTLTFNPGQPSTSSRKFSVPAARRRR